MEIETRTWFISEAVNGLVITRRESFVVWAFRTLDAEERRASGFGGAAGRVVGMGEEE